MDEPRSDMTYTCFNGCRRIGAGSLAQVALVVKHAMEKGPVGPVLIFDDATGSSIDINTRGSDEEVVARLAVDYPEALAACAPSMNEGGPENAGEGASGTRGRGRPKLGVVAREVTLLPRHWEWLATQPGGASVALRKLVEETRKSNREKDKVRMSHERAYHFMAAMAGDLPGFEEASRALFANDRARMSELIAAWPKDVRTHVVRLAFGQ